MRALDTNVLVRLLTGDDPPQAARAAALLGAAATQGEELFLSDVVVCEVVWVLRSQYRMPRARVAEALSHLLSTRGFRFAARRELEVAVGAFAAGAGDFADYLIREHARAAGCDAVVTFDAALHREPGFVPP